MRQTNQERTHDDDLHRAIRHIKMDRRETRVVTYMEQMAGVLQDVTDELEREPGLLISPEPRSFRFLHRSFQEHLAACELNGGDRMDRPHHQFPDVPVDLVLQKPALWRNVAELAADELRYQGRGHDLDRLLQVLSTPYRQAKANQPQLRLPEPSLRLLLFSGGGVSGPYFSVLS